MAAGGDPGPGSGAASDGAARAEAILQMLAERERVEVPDLARRFGVSEMTVRRDLADLDRMGRLQRVHGGAIARTPVPFSDRASVNAPAKKRMADAVAALISAEETVGLDAGTSCEAVAAALAPRADLMVVTSSLRAALPFSRSTSETLVLGGRMTSEGTLVDTWAIDALAQLRLSTYVLGCAGVSATDGICHFNLAETNVRRSFLRVSQRVVVVADASKFGKRLPIVLGGFDLVDVLVTDAEPPQELGEVLADAGVDVIVA